VLDSTNQNQQMFTGLTQDVLSGMWDTPNRELAPQGRWLSPDPAGQGWNQYAYSTNPNGNVDPSGLSATMAMMNGSGGWDWSTIASDSYGSTNDFGPQAFGTVDADADSGSSASGPQFCGCANDVTSGFLGNNTGASSVLPSLGPSDSGLPLLAPSSDPNAPASLVPDPNNPVPGGVGGDWYRLQLVNGLGNPMGDDIPVTEVAWGVTSDGQRYFTTNTQATGAIAPLTSGPGQILDFNGTGVSNPPDGSLNATQTWYAVWNGQQTGLTSVFNITVTISGGNVTSSRQTVTP
jgi:RHS repeat-associated protein